MLRCYISTTNNKPRARTDSTSDLSLPVDTDDATAGIVDSSDKDGLSADAVHVDAGARLNVVEVDVAKLGDQVDYVILGAHLEGLGEGRGDQKVEGERGGGRGGGRRRGDKGRKTV